MDLLHYLLFVLLGSIVSSINVERLRTEEIKGGTPTRTGHYKYTVALLYRLPGASGEYACTASILSNFFVATVAHCFYDKSSGKLRNALFFIMTGVINLLEKLPPWSQSIIVDTVTMLKIYNPKGPDDHTARGNIAVVKLADSLNLQANHSYQSDLALRTHYQKYLTSKHTVTGYGWVDVELVIEEVNGRFQYVQRGFSDGRLRQAKARILSDIECRNSLQVNIAPGNMCVKLIQKPGDPKPMGICKGDSGAPLVHNFFLDGIAMHSYLDCDEESLPGIYIDALYYRKFIDDVQLDHYNDEMYIVKLKENLAGEYEFREVRYQNS